MTIIFKDLIRQRDEAEKVIQTAKQQISDITLKIDRQQREINELPTLKRNTESAKQKALDQFVIGEISQADLDKAKKTYGDALQAEAEAAELLESMNRAKDSLTKAWPVLQRKLEITKEEIWKYIQDELKSKIRIHETIEKAFVAGSQAHCSGDYVNFIRSLFPQPSFERVNELKKAIEREYDFTDN